MLEKILKLEGAQQLTKKEQKSINGGLIYACNTDSDCRKVPKKPGERFYCVNGGCALEFTDPNI